MTPMDIQIEHDNEGGNVVFSSRFKRQLLRPWNDSIVVKPMGRLVGYLVLKC